MIGILCEKPSAGANFAKALGGRSGTFNGESYRIVHAAGHLYEWPDPEDMVDEDKKKRYHSWRMDYLPWDETDFHWKKVKSSGSAKLLKEIKDGLTGCDEIAIATDVDPTGEGELLAWEILDGLKLKPKKFTRIYHEDEEKKSIQKAFLARKELSSMKEDMDYVKADFRSKWDFCSMQWTRISTKYGDGRAVLRQGRLKSAMVLLVGDALKALEEYKEVSYYENRFKDENGIVYANKKEPRFASEAEVPQTYHASEVVFDGETLKHTIPPRLLDLASLSSMLAPRGYRAKEILAAYQKMYDAQVVSYPRTEDRFISREQFNELLPKAEQIASVVGVDVSLLTHKRPRATHVKSGGSHGANRPGSNVPSDLASLKKYGRSAPAIYETLAKNYLAMLAEDYTYHQQKGHLKDYPDFIGTANVPASKGWKAVFHYEEDKEEESTKGLGTKAEPFIYKGTNKKPPVPTMKWLMKQLEKHDVGTGATRTSIYADVTNEKAKYPLLKETRGKLSMTVYGNMSYQLLPDTHIGTLKITEQLQKQMREVSLGKVSPADCLKEIRQMIVDDKETMHKNSEHLIKETVALGKDGAVKHEAAPQKEKYEGTWNGKEISFNRVWGGHRFSDEECEKLCNGEEIILKGLKGRRKSTYDVKGKLAEQTYKGKKFIGFERTGYVNDLPKNETSVSASDQETDLVCPYCGKKLVLKKGPYGEYYNCPGSDLRLSRKYGGHIFTDAEVKTLLDLRETDYLQMKSRAGKPFEASAKLVNGKVTLNFKEKKRTRKTTRRKAG